MNLLDRAAPLPLYIQLKEAIERQIAERNLSPGDQLPTEAEIEEQFDVSRATVRNAFQALMLEGVVQRIQGRGTFVAEPRISHVPRLTSFTDNMRSQGYEPSRRVLESAISPPPPDVAARLRIPEDQPCRHIRRLLFADDQPVGVADTWLAKPVDEPDERFDPARLEAGSLYELLRTSAIGLDLSEGIEIVRPELAGAKVGSLLHCNAEDPVLVVERLSWDTLGEPVEATTLTFHGQRYEYRVPIG